MPNQSRESRALMALRIRIAQILISEELRKGGIRVPVHLALGHEWVAVDVVGAMGPGDKILLSHRNVAYHLVKRSLASVLHEYRSGRFGSMNMVDPDSGIVYTSSILANQFPVACGVALSDNAAGSGATTFVVAGDGAIEEGAFYESLMFAAKHELPIVFVVEDNGWSMSSPVCSRRLDVDIDELCFQIGGEVCVQDYRSRCPSRPVFVGDGLRFPHVWHMKVNTYGSKGHHYHHGPIDIDIDPEYPVLCGAERKLWSREDSRRILNELRGEIG